MPNVELVPVRLSYARQLYRWRREPTLVRFNPVILLSLRKTRAMLAELSSDLSEEGRKAYSWFVKADGRLIGTVTLKEINRQMKYGEIGYAISEKYHGKGYGKAAAALLVDKIFRESDLHKIQAMVCEKNIASRRLLHRLGFRQEGLLREHFVLNGRRVNEVLYAILRREWENGGGRRLPRARPFGQHNSSIQKEETGKRHRADR